jgi:hypothetical protein
MVRVAVAASPRSAKDRLKGSIGAPTPVILHEYQKEGVTGKIFRKLLILKGSIFVVWDWQSPKCLLKKKGERKLPQTSEVIYKG